MSQRHEHAEPPSGLYVSTAELSAAYLANEQNAKRLYGERWLSVTGVIAAVRTGESGQVDVAFTTASGNNGYQVHALFSGDADDIVAELKAGQTLTATCKVTDSPQPCLARLRRQRNLEPAERSDRQRTRTRTTDLHASGSVELWA